MCLFFPLFRSIFYIFLSCRIGLTWNSLETSYNLLLTFNGAIRGKEFGIIVIIFFINYLIIL